MPNPRFISYAAADLDSPRPTRRSRIDSRRKETAVGYLRRSTDQQGQSLDDQRSAIECYATDHGFRLIHCYVDDAITGTRSDVRTGFQEMIRAASQPGCDFGLIIVYDIKRFGRVDNDEAGHYRYILRKNGVEVRYASENFVGDSTDDLLRPVKQWQARQESKDLAKVTIRGLLSKVRSRQKTGCWMGGVPPYGFDLRYERPSGEFMFIVRYSQDGTKQVLAEDGHLLRTLGRRELPGISMNDQGRLIHGDPKRVDAVREIYRLYLEDGFGLKVIADRLNRLRVPTARSREWSSHYKNGWAPTTIYGILENPAYAGHLAWNRSTSGKFFRISGDRCIERTDVLVRKSDWNEEVDWIIIRDVHDPIINRRDWERVNWLLRERFRIFQESGKRRYGQWPYRADRARFLLTGLMTCSACGHRYEGKILPATKGAPNGTPVYLCGGWLRRGKKFCRKGAVPRETVEQAVIRAVRKYYMNHDADVILETMRRQIQSDNIALGSLKRTIESQIQHIERRMFDLRHANPPLVSRSLEEQHNRFERELSIQQSRVKALEFLPLAPDEIPHLIPRHIDFVSRLEGILEHGNQAELQHVIRRCVCHAAVTPEHIDVHLRHLPAIAAVLPSLISCDHASFT